MMKKFLLVTLLILLFSNLCRFNLPWWTITPIAALVTLLLPLGNGFVAFLSGLLAGLLSWGLNAFLLNTANGGVIAGKMGQLFQGLSSTELVYVTALLGGLLAAFGALTGQWARALTTKEAQGKYYYRKRRRYGR